MGSSGDSEKVIQRLKDELRDAQEQANTEKYKFMELEGTNTHHFLHFMLFTHKNHKWNLFL